MEKAKLFLGLFFGVALLHVIGKFYHLTDLSVWTKPLILTFLLLYYFGATAKKRGLYVAAVLFSLLGDVLLIYEGEVNFMLGLLSFLTAHILFIVIVFNSLTKSIIKVKLVVFIPFSVVCLGLIMFLKDSLGEMLIPVVIYAIVILVFGAISLLNYLLHKSKSSLTLLVGSLFFLISDSVLAIDKFYEPNEIFPVIIMTTYILAQYLICRFMITSSFDQISQSRES